MHATALVLYADFFIWEIFLSLLNLLSSLMVQMLQARCMKKSVAFLQTPETPLAAEPYYHGRQSLRALGKCTTLFA